MTFRVLVADSMAEQGIEILQAAPHIEVDNRAGIERDELIQVLPEYDALIVRSRTKPDAEVIAAGRKLAVIGRAGIGVDNVDVKAATRQGVVVMNTPEGNATTTAEHTIALMMSMARMIPQATASLKAGKWEKKKFLGRELSRKTLGVIGLGNIGRIVADRANGLRMKVLGYDPFLSREDAAELGVESVQMEELLARADIITVHAPLNDETRGLISDAQIERMKAGVMLVNCARGGIYDEDALLRALETGKIGALALDVFAKEPPSPDHPLLKHERVICSPHVGASTKEAQVQVAVAIAEQIAAFAAGEAPRNAINMPRIAPSDFQVLGPYLDLAERMGSFVGQLQEQSLKSIAVEVYGEVAERPIGPIVSSAVAGALQHVFDRPVNAVNARLVAEERNVKVLESHSARSEKAFASLIRVSVEGDAEHAVAGTIFEGGEGRLVEVDGLHLEALPEGRILVIHNRDKPGVIGHIGSVLGAAGVNISRMQLALEKPSGEALSLVNIDAEATREVLEQLKQGDVLSVKQVNV